MKDVNERIQLHKKEKKENRCALIFVFCPKGRRTRRGRDRMVVGSTTTYAIGAYHH